MILNIDTSTSICSVCLSHHSKILGIREDFEGLNHATLLTPFIDELLKENSVKPDDLSAVSVSKGPGSYTGLRIGVSVAKGMAYALSKPLIAIDTLEFMAAGYLEENSELRGKKNVLLCPMIDARRMEVYSAIYDTASKEIREVKAEIIDENSFEEILKENELHIFGNGALKCIDTINSPSLFFKKDYRISSKFMAKLSAIKFKQKDFEDVAYFEPFYLKDFIATTPKKKII